MKEERVILSERLEDLQKAVEWAKEEQRKIQAERDKQEEKLSCED